MLGQAANGVSSSYDALLDLFDCLSNFLKRLEIYIMIPPNHVMTMTEILVKILVELLSVLALATKQIKEGRFSKSPIIRTCHMFNSSTCRREVREEVVGRR
jgi:hypothetical protein